MPESKIFRGLTGLFVAVILAGCGSDPGFDETTDFQPTEGSVRFVNLISDSPQLTILHGLESSNVLFPVAEPTERRFVDRYDWRIAYLNAANDEVTVAEGENQQILENTLSVFLFMGSLSAPNIQVVDIAPLAAEESGQGNARIWFASNSSQFDMVDFYFTAFGEGIDDKTPVATLTTGTASGLISVPADGEKQLRVTVAGTQQILFESGVFETPADTTDLFAVVDDFGPDSESHVDVIRSLNVAGSVIENFAQPVRSRLANFSSNATLSASLDNLVIPNIASGGRSNFNDATVGPQTVVLSAEGVSTEQLDINIRPGFFFTIYSFDDAENVGATRSLALIDDLRPVTDRSLFKFVNGTTETVDLYILRPGQAVEDNLPLLNDIGFLGTQTTEARSEAVEFTVTNDDGTETRATLSATLVEGESYSLLYDVSGELNLLSN